MKLLTKKQKLWLLKKHIKIDQIYMFPKFGFDVYKAPNFSSSERIDINPFTKSLDREYFLVKDKVNGFVKGNFYNKPLNKDFYLYEGDLADRDMLIALFLLIIGFVPMVIWNYLWVGKNKAFTDVETT